jgi:hypothetical protein
MSIELVTRKDLERSKKLLALTEQADKNAEMMDRSFRRRVCSK